MYVVRTNHNGFSLVELSIVLVILGLLVGGILTGQNLIHAAELRSVTTEYDRYMSALHIFKDKYLALPGDMPNATSFWDGASATCPGTDTQGNTDDSTCNGDGDGLIERIDTAPFGNEQFRAWQHLALAGLVEGVYEGVAGPGSSDYHSVIGFNVPRAKLGDLGWSIYYHDAGGDTWWFDVDYGHIFALGSQHATAATIDQGLTPEDAWNIDTKVDDGKPGMGSVIAHWWDDCTDATSFAGLNADGDAADYLLSASGDQCSLVFRRLF